MSGVYVACLLVSTACLILLDARFALAFGRRPAATSIALFLGVAFFMAWDAVGIGLGVFRHVDSRWATGVLLAPEFPLEELLFLVFLTYLTLILLSGWQRWRERRRQQ
ncbi:lycopene cyclase domain-containing protein [Microbacterium halophytorum]|uniref:lycopene cyclase domain-containing protein n=1 Tax=Microbacterium halophytorum TaxID=2067568 RepID=UPI000CFDD051|nr:lycopene cyclase domain-containing protein [Microbacterium halophytorum]